MNQNLPIFCILCQEKLKIERIEFTCKHSLCFECLPYILYNHLQIMVLKNDMGFDIKARTSCLVCPKGKSTMSWDQLIMTVGRNTETRSQKSLDEGAAQKNSSSERKISLYEKCKNSVKKLSNFFEENETIKNNEELHNRSKSCFQNLLCKCSSNKMLEYFCLDCKIAICSLCCKSLHQEHNHVFLSDNIFKNEKLNYQKASENLKNINLLFNDFQKSFLNTVHMIGQLEREKFNEICDELIFSINQLKKIKSQKFIEEYIQFKSHLSLIQNSIECLSQEIDKNQEIHPNKLFQINNFCDYEIFVEKIKNICLKSNENQEIIKVKNSIKEISAKLVEENIFKPIFQERVKKFPMYENTVMTDSQSTQCSKTIETYSRASDSVGSNPIELLKKNPTILEKGTFSPGYYKSNVTTSFIMGGENYLVWPGTYSSPSINKKISFSLENVNITPKNHKSEALKNYCCLHIYNLTLRKKETILKVNSSKLNVISTFSNDSKKWLYTADDFGVMRIYDIMNGKNFKEIHKIETNSGKEILSAIIFEDKYKEINHNDKGIYLLISFNDWKSPLLLYKLDIGKEEEIIREIRNPLKKSCWTLNFYHNQNISKTCIFAGFTSSFIKIYDIETNSWLSQQFETKAPVYSINFITGENEDYGTNFVVYTQGNNLIIIANIDNGKIIKKINMPNSEVVFDLCTWNWLKKIYFITTAQNKNAIKILDYDKSEPIVMSKETGDFLTVNLTKILINEPKTNKIQEIFVSYQYWNHSENQIIIYN